MARSYKILQHWNQWLAQQFLGNSLIEAEQQILSKLLKKHFGKHALLVGVPHQIELLHSSTIPCHTLISPFAHHENHANFIESDFHELPIMTGSIDLVMLPHTLEFVDNPRQLLSEACRIVKPEGLIAICAFNPYSLWGLKKLMTKTHSAPWTGNSIQAYKLKNWLRLADFELEEQRSILFRPPWNNRKTFKRLHFLEWMGSHCLPAFGGINVLLARAKVIPLTPIKVKWKQQLSGIRISTSISGHIARQSK